ncbi:MAG: ABC transporter permease [Bacteroidetes bacterium]|nr:ABC transporter permease [Bacteroidota bacterium]
MLDKDNWQEIFATIRKNKLRTFLTAFGVFWGIFMLVIMLGSGNGLQNGILKEFEGTATNSFFMWTQKTSKNYKGMKEGRSYSFNLQDMQALKQLPELDVVTAENQLGGYGSNNNVVRGTKTGNFTVFGEFPEKKSIEFVKVVSGRYINHNDITNCRKVCVIGNKVKQVLFSKTEDALGKYIQVNGIYFMVIGITQSTASGGQAIEQEQKVFIPFTTFQRAFNYGNKVMWFAIKSKDGIPASIAEQKAIEKIKERHKISPDDLTAVGHWNMEEEYNKLSGLFSGIRMLVWFVGTGTLIAGVIGVSNIMLIIVKERTKEIGIKRAIGATPFAISSQLIIESVFLTSIAGYLGLLAGIGLLELISSILPKEDGSMFQNPEVNIGVAISALFILILSGALAGIIPAKKAVSINPVDALRAE